MIEFIVSFQNTSLFKIVSITVTLLSFYQLILSRILNALFKSLKKSFENDAVSTNEILKIRRGGSWMNGSDLIHSYIRLPDDPNKKNSNIGFRLARNR